MDSTDCFLEILSAYQSSDSGCQVSLLEYCHRFGVDYYKFLGWYRHYKCQLTNPTSPSGMQLTPIHVNGSPLRSFTLYIISQICQIGQL